MNETKEAFTEMFGFSGYSKSKKLSFDEPFDFEGFAESSAKLSNDQINNLIQATAKKIGECVHPLETNSITLYTKEGESRQVYRCAFTFMRVSGGFPSGFGVQSDVMVREDGSAVCVGISTQPMRSQTAETVQPYILSTASDYEEFEFISKKNMPTIDALKAVS